MGADRVYLQQLSHLLDRGIEKEDRTGTGTISLFAQQMRFNLGEGFPLLTTKEINFNNVVTELLWFLKGDTNLKFLLDNNVNIWNKDAYRYYREQGGEKSYEDFIELARVEGFDMGKIYGKQWRDFGGVDQLSEVVRSIRENPSSRRHVVVAWNPPELNEGALPPCHYSFEFYVGGGCLNCKVNLRSNDFYLGNPYNIASYALLTEIIACMTDLIPGELVLSVTDMHLYKNHVEQAKEQLKRKPRNPPVLGMKRVHDKLEDYSVDDFVLVGYDPHPPIKAPLSVGLEGENK